MGAWTPAQREALTRALEETMTEWGSSRWASFRRCERSHHLGYDVKLERLGQRETHFGVGTLCHAVLRYMQDGVVAGEWAARRWEDVLEFASENPESIPEVLDEAHRLMRWYWAYWGTDNAGWPSEARIAGVEMHLETPEGFAALPHTGRCDTLLEVSGSLVIVDTKTRGRSLPKDDDLDDYKASLATRPQFLSLAAMLQMRDGLDEPPAVMVNAICKLKTPTFGRVLVPLEQRAIDAWKADHRLQAYKLSELYRLNSSEAHWARNLDNCAPEVGWRCQFYSYCHGSPESRALNYKLPGSSAAPEAAE